MIEFQGHFDGEEKIFPLSGTRAVAFCFCRGFRVCDIHRLSGIVEGIRFRTVTDVYRRFGVYFDIVSAKPFLHAGGRKGVLVGQEGDFECTFGFGGQGRDQAEDCEEQNHGQKKMAEKKEPGLAESEFRHPYIRVSGEVDRTFVIQNRQNQNDRTAQEKKI